MDIQNINGFNTTNFLSDGKASSQAARSEGEQNRFMSLVNSMKANAANTGAKRPEISASTVSSSQISSTHRLNGDYTQGFAGVYTSEKDKAAKPEGFAANSAMNGRQPVIDKTSDLYAQSMELENYMVKMMLSSARKTIQKSSLTGKDNEYAQEMYEDMMYDNYAEQLTKNAHFGLADAIYIELSGQK